MSAQRYMVHLDCSELVYINRDTNEMTDESDKRGIEFMHFFLKGQSFLYNQIRKMVGVIIQIFRGELEDDFIENTFKHNSLNVALAPGDGLLLEKVCYDKYNKMAPLEKTEIMIKLVKQNQEMEMFRNEVIKKISQRETIDKAFTRWLSYFDDYCDEYYIERKNINGNQDNK